MVINQLIGGIPDGGMIRRPICGTCGICSVPEDFLVQHISDIIAFYKPRSGVEWPWNLEVLPSGHIFWLENPPFTRPGQRLQKTNWKITMLFSWENTLFQFLWPFSIAIQWPLYATGQYPGICVVVDQGQFFFSFRRSTCIYISTCIHIDAYIILVCLCIYVYINIRTYDTYIHTYVRTYIHT